MAESVIELTWDTLVTRFAEIQAGATPSFDDGGGAYRTSVLKVYKCLFLKDSEPAEYPALGVWLQSWEKIPEDINKEVYVIDCMFWIGGYMNSNSDLDTVTSQTQLSKDVIALQHDLARVCSDLTTSNVNRIDNVTPVFIVDKNVKFVNVLPFQQNKAEFGFKLQVRIQWYDRSLLP